MLLVVYALLSWFPGGYQSSIGKIIGKICEPYLSLFDRLNLRLGPVDFTILVALFVWQFAGEAVIRIIANLVVLIF